MSPAAASARALILGTLARKRRSGIRLFRQPPMRDIESQRLAPTTADHRANRTPSERCNALLSCISKLPVPDCRRVPFLNHSLQVRTEAILPSGMQENRLFRPGCHRTRSRKARQDLQRDHSNARRESSAPVSQWVSEQIESKPNSDSPEYRYRS